MRISAHIKYNDLLIRLGFARHLLRWRRLIWRLPLSYMRGENYNLKLANRSINPNLNCRIALENRNLGVILRESGQRGAANVN